MVLTLANGALYFFQAGTEELVNEWVQTCNYWAARQSKEPLPGGVSNMGPPQSDPAYVTERKSSLAPSVPSSHDSDETQLDALKKNVAGLVKELQEHDELRGPMMALVRAASTFLTPLFHCL